MNNTITTDNLITLGSSLIVGGLIMGIAKDFIGDTSIIPNKKMKLK